MCVTQNVRDTNTEQRTYFESALYPHGLIHTQDSPALDNTLHDLALDQVFETIGKNAPNAAQAFRTPLNTVADITYRQGMFKGLDHPELRDATEEFLQGMITREQRDHAAAAAHSPYERGLWHLSAVNDYVATVTRFREKLTRFVPTCAPRSDCWRLLMEHTVAYCENESFIQLETHASDVRTRLDSLRYNMLIRGAKVTIAPTNDEINLADAVFDTFQRFRQGDVTDHRTPFRPPTFEHVQGWILDRVAQVHEEEFARLVAFTRETSHYIEPLLDRFVDEVRFYLAYLDYVTPMRNGGLSMSYPKVSVTSKETHLAETWDLALAARLAAKGETAVTNDLSLSGDERILVISGPNQGGKTTTARLFGQIHHLAAIGCPVPGHSAQLSLCDKVLTVFEHEEQLDTLEGRLGAEIHRLHEVFEQASSRTVIVINEAFASTAVHDARILTRDVLQRMSALETVGACVTFIDELSRLNTHTVSMVSRVDPEDPAIRTFKVERREADGRAYARALAKKHHLTKEQIDERLRLLVPADSFRNGEGGTVR